MVHSKSLIVLGLGIATIAGVKINHAPESSAAQPEHPPNHRAIWEISVTNITRGQIISPPVIYTHNARMMPLWTLGSPASKELAALAEDALNAGLVAKLNSNRNVAMVRVLKGKNGPILPGETATIRIDGSPGYAGRFNRLSMAGMLVITNDAFFGLNGVTLPLRSGHAMHRSPAYDAGSEANNEDCKFIPGPPCGNAKVRATMGAEGYVHIHAGIHGIKDLKPEAHDWRGDVASIRIRRVR